jgi:hypothetical protein
VSAGQILSYFGHSNLFMNIWIIFNRFAAVARDPAAAARWFDHIVGIMIDKVLGFSETECRPYARGGFFGTVRAYFGCVEAQGRGSLHMHTLIWVAGFPPTHADLIVKCQQDPAFVHAVRQFAESISQHSFAVGPTQLSCSTEGCLGSRDDLIDVPVAQNQRPTKLSAHNKEPFTIQCQRCKRFQHSTAVVQKYVQKFLDPRFINVSNDELLRTPLQHMPVTEAEFALVTQFQLATVAHDPCHRQSCFKSKGTGCRYGFPLDIVSLNTCPEVTPDGILRLNLPREVGSAWLTGHNIPVLLLFGCNNDVKVLIGEQAGAVYYIANYTTKDQQKVDSQATVLMAAYLRYRQRYNPVSTESRGTLAIVPAIDTTANKSRSLNESTDVPISVSATSPPLAEVDKSNSHLPSAPLSLEPIRAGRRMLMSMACTMGSKQEISAPLAALYILRKKFTYSSHKFARLLVPHFMGYVQGQEIEGQIFRDQQNSSGGFIVVPELFDYKYRSPLLHGECLYSFISHYSKHKIPRGTNVDSTDIFVPEVPKEENELHHQEYSNDDDSGVLTDGIHAFSHKHPQCETHQLQRFKVPRIPEFIGGRPPDLAAMEREENEEEKQRLMKKYAVFALMLFKPWQKPDDLCVAEAHGQCDWWTAWEQFRDSDAPTIQLAKTILRNVQEYYESKRKGKTSAEEHRAACGNEEGDMEANLQFAPNGDTLQLGDEDEALIIGQEEMACEGAALDLSELIRQENGELLQRLSEDVAVRTAETMNFHLPTTLDDEIGSAELLRGKLGQWKQDIEQSAEAGATGQEEEEEDTNVLEWDSSNPDDPRAVKTGQWMLEQPIPSRVYWIQRALQDQQREMIPLNGDLNFRLPFAGVDDGVHRPPTLGEISRIFRLNELQHAAFLSTSFLVLRHAWKCIRMDDRIILDEETRQMLTFIERSLPTTHVLFGLIGEGGTGKSHCIKAVEGFSKCWGFPKAIILTATTGVAAVTLKGVTIQSLVGWSSKTAKAPPDDDGRHSSSTSSVADRKRADRLRSCVVLVIDEISMMGQAGLGKVSSRLQRLLGSELSMGGLNVVFVGDFMQLPPVKDRPLYLASTKELEISGSEIWQAGVTQVIMLSQNNRSRGDPTHANLLSAIRNGKIRASGNDSEIVVLLESLNARRLKPYGGSAPNPVGYSPIVVYGNRLRQELNFVGVCGVATEQNPALLFEMKITSGDQARELGIDFVRQVRREEKVHPFQNHLLIVTGMPVSVTQNISVPRHGVANGTEGVVVGIVHRSDTAITRSFLRISNIGSNFQRRVPVDVASQLAECILVKIKDATFRFGGLPQGVFPIFPVNTVKKVTLAASGQSAKVKFEGFPLTPMFACTGHKTQAKTMDSLTLGDTKGAKSGWLYVVLSRTRTLNTIHLMKAITGQDLVKAGPNPEVKVEHARLAELHNQTVASLKATSSFIMSVPMSSNLHDCNELVPQQPIDMLVRPAAIKSSTIKDDGIVDQRESSSIVSTSFPNTTWPPVEARGNRFSWLYVPIIHEVFDTSMMLEERNLLRTHFPQFDSVVQFYQLEFRCRGIQMPVHHDSGYVHPKDQEMLLTDPYFDNGGQIPIAVEVLGSFGYETQQQARANYYRQHSSIVPQTSSNNKPIYFASSDQTHVVPGTNGDWSSSPTLGSLPNEVDTPTPMDVESATVCTPALRLPKRLLGALSATVGANSNTEPSAKVAKLTEDSDSSVKSDSNICILSSQESIQDEAGEWRQRLLSISGQVDTMHIHEFLTSLSLSHDQTTAVRNISTVLVEYQASRGAPYVSIQCAGVTVPFASLCRLLQPPQPQLQPTAAWLDDAVINAALQFISSTHDQIFFVSTLFWQYVTLRHQYGERIAGMLSSAESSPSRLVIIPINVGHSHWVIAVIDKQTREFALYDSLVEVTNRSNPTISTLIAVTDGRLLSLGDFQLVKRIGHCPRICQGDQINCGVAVILVAEMIADSVSSADSFTLSLPQFQCYRDRLLLHLVSIANR